MHKKEKRKGHWFPCISLGIEDGDFMVMLSAGVDLVDAFLYPLGTKMGELESLGNALLHPVYRIFNAFYEWPNNPNKSRLIKKKKNPYIKF